MIELGPRSEAIVSAVSLSSWRGRAGPLSRWQRTASCSRRGNWHPYRHWRPRNSSKHWNPTASVERTEPGWRTFAGRVAAVVLVAAAPVAFPVEVRSVDELHISGGNRCSKQNSSSINLFGFALSFA